MASIRPAFPKALDPAEPEASDADPSPPTHPPKHKHPGRFTSLLTEPNKSRCTLPSLEPGSGHVGKEGGSIT